MLLFAVIWFCLFYMYFIHLGRQLRFLVLFNNSCGEFFVRNCVSFNNFMISKTAALVTVASNGCQQILFEEILHLAASCDDLTPANINDFDYGK